MPEIDPAHPYAGAVKGFIGLGVISAFFIAMFLMFGANNTPGAYTGDSTVPWEPTTVQQGDR